MQRPKGKIALKNYKENIITNKRVSPPPNLSLNIPKYHNSVELEGYLKISKLAQIIQFVLSERLR